MTTRHIMGRVLISMTSAEYADLIAAAMDVDDQLQPEHVSRPISRLLAAHEASPLSSRPTAQSRRPAVAGSQLTAHGSELPMVITGPGGSYARPWPRALPNCPLSPNSVAEMLGADDLAAISAEALPLAHG